mgnify:FL=1
MKMKKKMVIIFYMVSAIIALACIFCIVDMKRVEAKEEPIFAIQTDVVNDGGSTIYMGLGYKIINYVKPTSPPFVSIAKIGTWFMKYNNPFRTDIEYIDSQFIGTIIEVGEKYIIVTPDEGEEELKSSDQIEVGITSSDEAKVGRKVEVTYTGEIMESYPAKVNAINVIYLEEVEAEEMEAKLQLINESSSQKVENINPNVTEKEATDVVTWEYTGEVVADDSAKDLSRPIYGFEFQLTYSEEDDSFYAEPGMGDCDKIKYYTISNNKIIIAVDAEETISYNFYAIHFNRNPLTTEPENWCENYDEGAKITKEGDTNFIELKFNKNYAKGELKNLDISFGKID